MILKDKVAIITGSSKGIGKAIARRFSDLGAKVVVTYSKSKIEAESFAKEIASELVLQLDVANRDSVKQLMRTVNEKYGKIDILVNNAGINITGDFDKITDNQWDDVLNVNLKGVFICSQEVLPYISDGGRVINIGSISGEYGGPRTPSYAAAKAGVMSLTHCMARFVANRNITVNCVSPGVIESDMANETMTEELKNKVLSMSLLKRFGTYEEVADACAFIASDQSGYITAQTISINGGAWVR